MTETVRVLAVFVLAGTVKGITGLGLPTVAVSLLSLWMAPAQAAALLVLPALATNVAQCVGPHFRAIAARLWPTWLALAVVLVATPEFDAHRLGFDPRRLLGVVLIVYGTWGLMKPALPDLSHRSRAIGFVVGGLTGLVTATTAVFVVPLVPYLQSMRFDKDTTVQAFGLSFMVATLGLTARLGHGGHLSLLSASTGLAVLGAFAGLAAGAFVRARISAAAFQRALFVIFIALGVAGLIS